MKTEAVIFDMDGVLVDTEPIYIEINRKIFSRLGVEIPMERHLGYIGISGEKMWGEIGDEFGLSQAVDELIRTEKKAQVECLGEMDIIPVVPGIRTLLDEFERREIRCALASSSSRRVIDLILRKTGFDRYFEVIVSGEDVSHGKPAPDIFIEAASLLSVDPSRCLVIEDSPHGIEGAKAAGMMCVGFVNPSSGNQALERADLVIDEFANRTIKKIVAMLIVGS